MYVIKKHNDAGFNKRTWNYITWL